MARPLGSISRHQVLYTRRVEGPGGTTFAEPSTEYFQYVDLGGPGLTPSGYGYWSVEQLVRAVHRVETSADRLATPKEIDDAGILATPANSSFNEAVVEAARQSIQGGGREIRTNSPV